MRMWGVAPHKMCRKHLLGEHVEMHMFAGTLKKGISVDGYIDNGLVDFNILWERHEELAVEIVRRGYKHSSPLLEYRGAYDPTNAGHVDIAANEVELHNRCKECQF